MVIESLDRYVNSEDLLKIVKFVANQRAFEVIKRGFEDKKEGNSNEYGCTKHHVMNHEYELSSNVTVYIFHQRQEYQHTNGHGGHWLYESVLFNKNNPEKKLLESRLYLPWSTDSDDRTDYSAGGSKNITLYQEEEFARAVFEKAKKIAGEENEHLLVRLLLGGV